MLPRSGGVVLLASLLLCSLVHCVNGQADTTTVVTGTGTASALLIHNMLLAWLASDDGSTVSYTEDTDPNAVLSRVLNEEVDFSMTEQYLSMAQHTNGSCCGCDDIRAIPLALSGYVFVHSIGGFGASTAPLYISRQDLVKIFLGNITTWNQLDSSLPNATIKVAHESCHGTTDTITLGFKMMNSEWTATCPGIAWPTGVSLDSGAQMLEYIEQTPNAIGYLAYSEYLFAITDPNMRINQQVGVINKFGNKILASREAFIAASEDFQDTIVADDRGVVGDLVDAPGPSSWPFSYYEYAHLRSRSNSCDKLQSLFSFIVWVLTAREVLAEQLEPFGVASIPSVTLARCLTMVNSFVCCTRQSVTDVVTKGTFFGHQTFDGVGFTYISGSIQLQDAFTTSADALTQVAAGTIDAALSTVYPSNTDHVLPIRLFAGAVVCAANINGLTSANSIIVDGSILANIFENPSSSSWGAQSITNYNPNYVSNLQATGSVVVQSFPDTDTRTIFSQAMSQFSASYTGNNLPGVLYNPPVSNASQVLLDKIAITPGAIGCFPYFTGLIYPSAVTLLGMKNAAGNIIAKPTWENVMSAMQDFTPIDTSIINGKGNNTWPICAYDYLVINTNSGRCTQMSKLAQFAVWIFTQSDAQGYVTADGLSYPPSAVRLAEQERLVEMKCGGTSLTPEIKDIYGVGASLPFLAYQSWPIYYATLPDPITNDPTVHVRVSYATSASVGETELYASPLGEYFVEHSLADFGATDVPLPVADGFAKFPTLGGGLALVFNLGPLTTLVLSRPVIVKIFSGAITKWNDAAIVALNPVFGSLLPNEDIVLVYRATPCGSTYVMKQALRAFSSDEAKWDYPVSVNATWPVASSKYGITSYDITSVVAVNGYTLGYVEHSYATFAGSAVCSIVNKYGTTVLPTAETISSAMKDFPLNNSAVLDIVDAPGQNSYPLATYTYIITNKTWTKCDTATRALSFLHTSITADIPRSRAARFGYIPLPNDTIYFVEEEMRKITCGANKDYALPVIARGCDGVVGSPVRLDACGVCGGSNTTCCLGTKDQVDKYCFSCKYLKGEVPYILNSYKCDGFLDCDEAEDDIHCKVSIVQTSIVLSAISGVCIIICFVIGFDLLYNRNERIFRESNVFFMMMILAGCIIGYATVFVLSQLTKLNNFVCGVQYWFFGIAFVLTFGSMIAKTYQVYMLHRQHSGDLSAYTNQAIVRYVAAAMSIVLIILIIWTAFDRPRPVLRHNDPSDDSKQHFICGNDHFTVFAILLALYFGIILVSGVVLSFLSREIDFEGNESRLIRKTILSAALLAVVILPILIALGSSFPFVRILLSNVAVLLIASLILFTYFGPKLTLYHLGGESGFTEMKSRLVGPIDI